MGGGLTIRSYRSEIEWVNGTPTIIDKDIISDRGLKDLVPTALSLPYQGKIISEPDENGRFVDRREIEPEFEGMTNAEVMVIKEAQRAAAGNSDATHRLLDRILGKPKQQNENLNVNASYSDYLESLERQENTTEYPSDEGDNLDGL